MYNFLEDDRGLTIAELLAVIAVLIILIGAVLLIVNPTELQAKARDNKRLSDMSVLDRAVSEYMLDNSSYPDAQDTIRSSTTLPEGNSGPLTSPIDGWIDVNLVDYTPNLPIDPINDATYKYSYIHDQYSYELNAVLEVQVEYMTGDGGSSDTVYEIGNNLSLL